MINFLEVNWKSNLFSNKFNNVVGDIWTTNLPQTFFQILGDMKHILFFDWTVYCTVNILYFRETVHITQCYTEKNLHLKAMYSSAAIFIYNPFLFFWNRYFLKNLEATRNCNLQISLCPLGSEISRFLLLIVVKWSGIVSLAGQSCIEIISNIFAQYNTVLSYSNLVFLNPIVILEKNRRKCFNC